jgi:hypothetical protein
MKRCYELKYTSGKVGIQAGRLDGHSYDSATEKGGFWFANGLPLWRNTNADLSALNGGCGGSFNACISCYGCSSFPGKMSDGLADTLADKVWRGGVTASTCGSYKHDGKSKGGHFVPSLRGCP